MTTFMLLIIVAALAGITYHLSRIRAVLLSLAAEAVMPSDNCYSTQYPVFSEREVRLAYRDAVEATKRCRLMPVAEERLVQAAEARVVLAELQNDMLVWCKAKLESERLWHCHATMMEANLSALQGKLSREDVLKIGEERLGYIPPTRGPVANAHTMRDEWVARLVTSPENAGPHFVGPHDNPWADRPFVW